MKYVHVQYCTHRIYAYYHKTNILNTIRQNFNFKLKIKKKHFLINHSPMPYMYVIFIISFKGTLGNCADKDQVGHNEVSDQGLYCYLRNFYL